MNAPVNALNILIAAGEPAMLAVGLTPSGHTLLIAPDVRTALSLLRTHTSQLLISDLPFSDSLDLCRAVRAQSDTADLWFLLIATRLDEAALDAARAAGVSDIAVWPIKPMDLRCRLLAAGRAIELQRELDRRMHAAAQLNADLTASNTRLQHIAITDDLTGLFNRRHALAKLNEYWSIAERYRQQLACAIIDLDHFKAVNDTYGHFVGDVVLRRVASVLTETVRTTDLVCRIGGEEFLLIFPAQGAEQILPCVDRCRSMVAAQRIVSGDDELSVTISAGVAEKMPGLTGPEELLKRADAALYEAKHAGRNCIILHGRAPSPRPLAA
jgi:two-component system, cell cycle response regulator